jgi:hypothetical protein
MTQKLTPALLAGKSYMETIELKLNEEVFEIEIRPLTHIEKKQVEACEQASVKVNTKSAGTTGKLNTQSFEVNAGELLRDQGNAQLKAVALGTVDTEWSEETINQWWKSEWIEQVYQRIAEITGFPTKQGQKQDSFRS